MLYNPNTLTHKKTIQKIKTVNINNVHLEHGSSIPSSLVQIDKDIGSLLNASYPINAERCVQHLLSERLRLSA